MKLNLAAKIALLVLVIGPFAIFVFGSVVMLLWNNVAVPVLHVSTITFWQALGILVLAKILFGHFGSGASNRYYRKQRMLWKHMTPEQREQFKQEWKRRRWGSRSSGTEAGHGIDDSL